MAGIREALEAAHESVTSGDAAPEVDDSLESGPDNEAAGPVEPDEPGDDAGSIPEGGKPKEKSEGGEGRVRDAQGKFQPKPTAPPGAKVGVPAPLAQTPPPAETLRAPQSLTPEEREEFNRSTPTIQKAIIRREQEYARGVQDAGEARRFRETYQQALQPIAPIIAASGQTPERFVGDLVQQVAMLNHGAPQQKAQFMADLFQRFGIDPGAVADVLEGKGGARGPQQLDPNQLAHQIRQQVMQDFQSQAQQQRAQQADREVQQWATSTHREFLGAGKVNYFMAKLLEDVEASGQPVTTKTLDEAYETACRMDPSTRGVMLQRDGEAARAKAKAEQDARLAKARSAGVSVRSNPAGVVDGSAKPSGIRAHLEAAAEQLSRKD